MKKIIIWIVVISFGVWFWQNRDDKTPKITEQLKTEQKTAEETKCFSTNYRECKEFPWLDLPIKYFSINDIEWGSASAVGNEIKLESYTHAALDNKAVYQTYPTTTTTIKKYSADIIPISTKKYIDVKKKIQEVEVNSSWMETVDENYKEYGQLAVHFLDGFQDIEMFDSFDVDDDGIKEKILGLNSVGRASGGSYNAAVVKGDKILFYVNEDESFIVPADTPNGFYVKWRSPDDDSARCCPGGYIKTRFVFQDGKFVPLYEQKVRFVIVGKK